MEAITKELCNNELILFRWHSLDDATKNLASVGLCTKPIIIFCITCILVNILTNGIIENINFLHVLVIILCWTDQYY